MLVINVKKTVQQILAVPNVQFKLFKEDESTGTVLLSTPVNDDFSRGVISIDSDKVSVGVQGPNKEGKIVLTFQPIASEILNLIVFEETETSDQVVDSVVEE